MKKIRVWVVLLLNIVTLGIYGIFWLVKRRREMVENYKQTIPHWAWLIVPSIILAALGLLLLFMSSAMKWDQNTTFVAILAYVAVAALIALAISIWWMVKFARAAAYVVNGRMTAGWIVVLYIFIGSLVGLFLQYYFNRSASPIARANEAPQKPSKKFVIVALVCIVLSAAGSAGSIALDPSKYNFNSPMTQQSNEQAQRVNQLLTEFNDCTAKLEKDYPAVTADNETAYNAAYDACDAIRVEQNNAVDDYNKSIQQ